MDGNLAYFRLKSGETKAGKRDDLPTRAVPPFALGSKQKVYPDPGWTKHIETRTVSAKCNVLPRFPSNSR
jgi:hypothetical protein